MSSRNRYLKQRKRQQALAISRSLAHAAHLARQGQRNAATIRQDMRSVLESAGISRIDYVALSIRTTWRTSTPVQDDTMALVAAFVAARG